VAEARTDETDESEGLADQFKVLSNAKRLRLLRFLVQPHYLEEIASELRMARQTAQEHVQLLLDEGLVRKVAGRRDTGPVADYVVVPQRLFALYESMGKLAGLQPDVGEEALRPQTQALKTGLAPQRAQELPRLTIVHGLHIGRTVALTGSGPWLIGRDPHAAACLDYDPFVSQRHAEVRRGSAGYELADLYSSNGTFLDWKKVSRGGSERLANGDVVRIGKTLLVFRHPTL